MSAMIFDPAVLDDLKQLDPQIVKEVTELFFQQFPKELGLLEQIAKTGDGPALSKKAHLMKSSAKQVGGLRLGEICYQLEKEPSSPETPARIAALPAEFESLKKELEKYGERA